MKKITESGWKKSDGDNIKEEDIRALFDMIDRDRSGSLSKRVISRYNMICRYRHNIMYHIFLLARRPKELQN